MKNKFINLFNGEIEELDNNEPVVHRISFYGNKYDAVLYNLKSEQGKIILKNYGKYQTHY